MSPSLENLVAEWPEGNGVLLVQPYVAGLRNNVYFAARSGRMLASVHTRLLRTDRIDGTGNVVEGVTVTTDPRLIAYCDALLARLDYSGVGTAQFIVPDDGTPSFLEINPRHGGAYAIAGWCGLGLTLAAIELAGAARRWQPSPDFRYPAGRRYVWTSRDLRGLGRAVSGREIKAGSALRWLAASLQAAARADVHLTWSRDDPRPTFAVCVHLATLGPWRRRRAQAGGRA